MIGLARCGLVGEVRRLVCCGGRELQWTHGTPALRSREYRIVCYIARIDDTYT